MAAAHSSEALSTKLHGNIHKKDSGLGQQQSSHTFATELVIIHSGNPVFCRRMWIVVRGPTDKEWKLTDTALPQTKPLNAVSAN
jgi:hypothetical protein